MSTLQRRLTMLEEAARDQFVRDCLGDTLSEPELQHVLKDYLQAAPHLEAMHRRGATVGEVAAWLAATYDLDADELLAEFERSRPHGRVG